MITHLIMFSKLVLAGTLGFLIGKERKKKDKPGGSRTFAMVSLGSCLISLISLEIIKMPLPDGVVINFTRMISYAIASIGFLGGSIILHNKGEIDGLTTSASIFAVVPVGISIGLGYYFLGISTSILMYIILEYKYWKEGEIKWLKRKK